MLLTAKELQKELNISVELWRYWRYYRTEKHYKFPAPDDFKYANRYHPRAAAWELAWFKEWWEGRPDCGRPFTDITNV
jgi:hypothetical protein